MTLILLKFFINLNNYEDRFHRHYGPLFHRWLPNGEQDALSLQTRSSNSKLKVWFERNGFVEHEQIVYDQKRNEVDPVVMSKQAVLEAGHLVGLLEYDVTNDEIVTLQENKMGSGTYKQLGVKIVKTIQPPVSEFIQLLRIRLGQYWIRELEKWNSTEKSIGEYCKFLFIKWSIDCGKTWSVFLPDNEHMPINVHLDSSENFSSYLTEKDWKTLPELLKRQNSPSLAEITLNRTHQYLDQGDLRHAIIEGATAVELIIPDFFRKKLGGNRDLEKEMSGFWNSSVSSQLVTIGTIIGIPQRDLGEILQVITLRHKIVHEGLIPNENEESKVLTLLRTIAILLGKPNFRFPKSNHGNAILSSDLWEDEYRKISK